jgi:hypothetical protein
MKEIKQKNLRKKNETRIAIAEEYTERRRVLLDLPTLS